MIAEEDGATPKKDAGDFFSRVWSSAGISGVYTGASTLLAGYLLWVEATSGVVGLAWGLFGLVLIEAAGLTRDKALLWQGRALLVASLTDIRGGILVLDVASRCAAGAGDYGDDSRGDLLLRCIYLGGLAANTKRGVVDGNDFGCRAAPF